MMREKVAESMSRTPLSLKNTPSSVGKGKNSSYSTPTKSNSGTPVKGILRTPTSRGVLSNSNTPTKSILKTPTSRGKRKVEPDTPASTRKRVKKTLIRIAEESETLTYSGSDSEEEEEDKESEDDED